MNIITKSFLLFSLGLLMTPQVVLAQAPGADMAGAAAKKEPAAGDDASAAESEAVDAVDAGNSAALPNADGVAEDDLMLPMGNEENQNIVKAKPLDEGKPAKETDTAMVKKADPLDPVSGTVPLSDLGHYDMYERQIRYKKADREFRTSIEARRVSFETPRQNDYNKYKQNLETLYGKETQDYQKSVEEEEKKKEMDMANLPPVPPPAVGAPSDPANKDSISLEEPKDERPVVPVGEPEENIKAEGKPVQSPPQKVAVAPKQPNATPTNTPPEQKVGTKEILVETTPEVGAPKKKIIVPEDAPDFPNSPF